MHRFLVLATLVVFLLTIPALAPADPTWSTAFAPDGFDEAPGHAALHSSQIIVQGNFTRMNATALAGLGLFDGNLATDLGGSFAAFLAGQGLVVVSTGRAISWNGDVVLAARYGPSQSVIYGQGLFAWDGTSWSELPAPPYVLDTLPVADLWVWNGDLLVRADFRDEPAGARLAALDTGGTWTMLAAPLPEVEPETWWEPWGEAQASSVAIVGGELYVYSASVWLTDGFSPSYYEHFWRIDRHDGTGWVAVTTGAETTHGAAMGGYVPATVWAMDLHAVGSSLFRTTETGYQTAPDQELHAFAGGTTWSSDLSPPQATWIDGFAPAAAGAVGWGSAADGDWVGSFDGSAWTLHGQQIDGQVSTVIESDGALYVFGGFRSVDGLPIRDAALYGAGAWSALFDGSLAPRGTVLDIQPFDGQLYASTAGADFPGLAASIGVWNGSKWVDAGSPGPGTPTVRVLQPWEGVLLAGADMDLCATDGAQTTCTHGVAALQADTWISMGHLQPNQLCFDYDCQVFPTYVEDLQEYSGELFVAGTFMGSDAGPLPSGVARWSSPDDDWIHPGAAFPDLSRYASFFGEPFVRCLEVYNGMMLVGGDFSWDAQSNVALLGYDTTQAVPLGSSLFTTWDQYELPEVVEILVRPEGLYVAGDLRPQDPSDPLAVIAFQPAGEFPDGAWYPLGTGVNGAVNCMLEYDGGILVGGTFPEAGGLSCSSIALWDGTAWSVPFEGVVNANGAPGTVEALALVGNDLHIGGSFDSAGGVPAANYAILESEPAVGVGDTPANAGRTALLGAFPNPFNPSTEIRFTLSDPASSRLELFDTAGRCVRGFDLRLQTTGPGSVRWDGRDARGRRVASGVYFARLEGGGIVDRGRLVLLK